VMSHSFKPPTTFAVDVDPPTRAPRRPCHCRCWCERPSSAHGAVRGAPKFGRSSLSGGCDVQRNTSLCAGTVPQRAESPCPLVGRASQRAGSGGRVAIKSSMQRGGNRANSPGCAARRASSPGGTRGVAAQRSRAASAGCSFRPSAASQRADINRQAKPALVSSSGMKHLRKLAFHREDAYDGVRDASVRAQRNEVEEEQEDRRPRQRGDMAHAHGENSAGAGEMDQCPVCNTDYLEDSRFCRICGRERTQEPGGEGTPLNARRRVPAEEPRHDASQTLPAQAHWGGDSPEGAAREEAPDGGGAGGVNGRSEERGWGGHFYRMPPAGRRLPCREHHKRFVPAMWAHQSAESSGVRMALDSWGTWRYWEPGAYGHDVGGRNLMHVEAPADEATIVGGAWAEKSQRKGFTEQCRTCACFGDSAVCPSCGWPRHN